MRLSYERRIMSATENAGWLRAALAASVIIHLIASFWHAAAHLIIPVALTAWQQLFIGFVILLLPLIGLGLLGTSRRQLAAWIVTLSMFGSLLFGFINHYMRLSPDYVLVVPEHAWRYSFVVSAALLAVTETIGLVLGAVAIWTWRRTA
jgi:hypothetical protein